MHFPYQDLPPSPRLRYELVDWSNVQAYLPLFANDPSPFVDQRLKHQARLEAYAEELLTDLRYSRKRGACDWLVRRRTDSQPVGVVHLYNLSHEVSCGRIPYCAIGYALAAPFRRQGFGQEALSQLLMQATELFGRTEVRALSAVENLASQTLLQRCGFTLLEERAAAYRRGGVRLWQRPLLLPEQEPNMLHGAGK